MINPFASFLQPQFRTLEGAPSFGEIESIGRGRRQDAQRALENTQQHALAQQGAKRADSQLKLQQDDQAHRFTADEQKQVEGLLAEYQDAEDQGDQVRLSRATQMLKRFGMDVGQKGGMDPRAQAFTGGVKPLPGQLLPQVATKMDPRAQAFTGAAPEEADLSQEDWEKQFIGEGGNPIDQAIETELATREKLRANNAVEEPDIAGHLASVGPLKALKLNTPEQQAASGTTDLGSVDDPAFKAAADSEVIDLDKEDPAPLQVGQLPKVATAEAPQAAASGAQPPPRLPGQLLPTVISKGGKQLYESTGPSGRWAPMVSGVFEPFTQHENPEMGAAAKRAQAYAQQLIAADGVAPKEAIKAGMDYLQGEATRLTNLERTKIGSKPKYGTSSGVPGKFQALGPKEDRAESIKGYITESRGAVGKLNESDRLLAQAEALANSKDPALQRNAIDILVQSRSGATVSDRERARYDQLDGAISQAQNYIARWSGGPLDPQYVNKIKMVIAEQRRINASTREEVAADLEEAYAAQNEGKVDAPILQRRKAALGKTIRRDTSEAGPGGYDPELD